VKVLVVVFHKMKTMPRQIMLSVHNHGVGVCGEYTAEVAEMKVSLVHRLARGERLSLKMQHGRGLNAQQEIGTGYSPAPSRKSSAAVMEYLTLEHLLFAMLLEESGR